MDVRNYGQSIKNAPPHVDNCMALIFVFILYCLWWRVVMEL